MSVKERFDYTFRPSEDDMEILYCWDAGDGDTDCMRVSIPDIWNFIEQELKRARRESVMGFVKFFFGKHDAMSRKQYVIWYRTTKKIAEQYLEGIEE